MTSNINLSKSPTVNERVDVTTELAFDSELRRPEGTGDELIILLHGYSESGLRIFRRLESVLPAHAYVLAPNALFPMPEKTPEGKIKLGFSWYFYDIASDEYFMDMRYAVAFLASGIEKLGFSKMKKTIIGFSQGGYLAPFAAQKLGNVKQVIGIGCSFLADEIPGVPPFRMDAVHGENDRIVEYEGAKCNHSALVRRGIKGEFHLLSGSEHHIDEKVRDKVKEILI